MGKQIFSFLISIIFSVFFLELGLSIYNPVRSTVSGNQIKLEKNVIRTIKNSILPCFDKVIFHKVNSIGFRGDDPPEDFDSCFSILTVGGSTTHSFYNAEGTTWTDILGEKLKNTFIHKVWINNAGLDGHSTFGHILLVDDYISRLKPDMLIFLVGVNDIGRMKIEDGVVGERTGINKLQIDDKVSSLKKFINDAALKSELIATLLNLYRLQQAQQIIEGQWNVGHRMIDVRKVKTIVRSDQQEPPYLEKKYLDAYQQRIRKIIALCRKNNIIPVFLSSPALFGDAIDPSTGIDLGNVITEDLFELSGSRTWQMMDGYNRALQTVCKEEKVTFIDFANKMPKDSKYFYDWLHFTNEGSQKAAEIIFNDLVKILPEDIRRSLSDKRLEMVGLEGKNDLQADNVIQKMWEIAPNNPDLCFKMGDIYEKEGNSDEAIKMFQKSLSAEHLHVQALTRLAKIYSQKKEYNKSISFYLQIIKYKPEISSAYYNIACLYSKQNQLQNSLQWLEMAINKGYDKWDLIQSDKDLQNIRSTQQYQQLLTMKKH